MDRERLPLAPVYADVRASCSHVKMYCKRARLLSSHPRLITLHSFHFTSFQSQINTAMLFLLCTREHLTLYWFFFRKFRLEIIMKIKIRATFATSYKKNRTCHGFRRHLDDGAEQWYIRWMGLSSVWTTGAWYSFLIRLSFSFFFFGGGGTGGTGGTGGAFWTYVRKQEVFK